MQKKHQKTLQLVFDRPIRSDVPWQEIEHVLKGAGQGFALL